MPTSESTVAQTPLLVSSWPTVGPTISVPTTVNVPDVALLERGDDRVLLLAELRARFGRRAAACGPSPAFDAGVPYAWTSTFWPPPGKIPVERGPAPAAPRSAARTRVMTTVPPANSTPRGMPFVASVTMPAMMMTHDSDDRVPAPAQEVVVGVLENMHG